jgi:hypothetical protein
MTSGGGEVLADLARRPGLEEAAEQLAGVVAIARAEQARQAAGAAVTRPAWKNLVFTGPGAGKSRAAAAVARAYRDLGVLSSGHLTEAAAQDLATNDVQRTGQLVREAVGRGRSFSPAHNGQLDKVAGLHGVSPKFPGRTYLEFRYGSSDDCAGTADPAGAAA